MTTEWMIYGLLTSSVLSLAALALERVCRIRRCATRWVWVAAMAVPLLLPFVSSTSSTQATERSGPLASSEQAAAAWHLSGFEPAQEVHRVSRAGELDGILQITWFAGSCVLAMLLALGSWHVRRKTLHHTTIDRTAVEIAEDVGPAVVGWFRPRIVVPTWFMALDATTQRTALAHECAHIQAHDSRLGAAALLLLVAMPWNLPLWWQWRRLRQAIEIDCDARVLRAGHDASSYGEALLAIAEHRCHAPMFAPAMYGSARALERRIELLFAPRQRWPQPFMAGLTIFAAGCAVAAAQVEPPERFNGTEYKVVIGPRASAPTEEIAGGDLIDAVLSRDVVTAKALLENGADANGVRLGDGTPLILASRAGDEGMVQLLLEHGADVNLAARGDGNPLIMAAARGNLAIARTLVERGADVNGVVIGDETPLINAARRGHIDLVRYLVDSGADVNLAVRESAAPFAEIRSPLSEAKKYRRAAIVDYLLALGARQ